MTKNTAEKAIELRKLVREYLKCTECVPMRAVDCDQELEEDLREKLKKAVK